MNSPDTWRLLGEALASRCCHISGQHDPSHYEKDVYLCATSCQQPGTMRFFFSDCGIWTTPVAL